TCASLFFFLQAEDGIRDGSVTGVQTCALPIWWAAHHRQHHAHSDGAGDVHSPETSGFLHAHIGWLFRATAVHPDFRTVRDFAKRSEERRVGKEGRSRGGA